MKGIEAAPPYKANEYHSPDDPQDTSKARVQCNKALTIYSDPANASSQEPITISLPSYSVTDPNNDSGLDRLRARCVSIVAAWGGKYAAAHHVCLRRHDNSRGSSLEAIFKKDLTKRKDSFKAHVRTSHKENLVEGDYKLKTESALRSLEEFILRGNDEMIAKAGRERVNQSAEHGRKTLGMVRPQSTLKASDEMKYYPGG
ncbi:hypothetical protein P171DRAFT_472089 [Karstenula rhodostoma CBS 690.94]|uniref:Uncharacterized protein n=1 Tax=Karstenula rhodostoma CBS 690.94 TaxID=1392251 RepID=A0A9P4PP02_9PLEO|nr:hypothetical protein P171DRAFT_472089 [Karstenula rhodostoma CBS 690.94]